MHPGELSAAKIMAHSKSPAYPRRDCKVKSWEVRGGTLLGVSYISIGIEL